MKCPTCVKEGKRSKVHIGHSTTTLLNVHWFYDEDGEEHCHDPNTSLTGYSCTRGHQWQVQDKNDCWCGWGKKDVK